MADMRLVVTGAAGRMGRMLVKTIYETPGLVLTGALEREGSIALGEDAGLLAGCGNTGVAISTDALGALLNADGILDFSTPAGSVEFAALAAQARIVDVIGTTGLSAEDLKRIGAAARHAAIVRSGNMSLGVNLLGALTRQVAKALGEDFDIEIVEMHHRMKVDAPSGTALLRDGQTGARKTGDIGFASLRGGSVVGDHSVIFAGESERIELTHRAQDRTGFARGAVRAALWAHGRKAGLYSMADVLGIAEA
jgi:4-hydroxy-tetrahydrodipicolinate reductase